MNSIDALRQMAASYPGGREALAVRLGVTDEVLRKELSGAPSHKLGVIRAEQISEYCIEAGSEHCFAYANAVASKAGRLVELPVREMKAKQDLRDDAASVVKEGTDVLMELNTALADEVISDNELRRIEKEVSEVFEKLQSLLRGAQARNAAGKPSLRAA